MASTPRILVVDDNEDCLALVGRMLRGHGFEVLAASDGSTALAILEDDSPDLVLLDVMMPGMTGFEVLETVRQSSKHYALPVIMLTASTNDDDVMSAYQYGSDYYITKPFTSEQLRYGIDMVLGREPATSSEEA